jgi:predicted permease
MPVEPGPGVEAPDPSPTLLTLRDELAALPGVTGVTWTNYVPLGLGGVGRRHVTAQGHQPPPGDDLEFDFGVVGPDYFETLGVQLIAGRGFGNADRAGAPGVAVVNESLARYFWGNENPLGRSVSVSGDWLEVVGVAKDGPYNSLGESPRPVIYTSALQESWGATMVIATIADPAGLMTPVRRALAATAPGWITGDIRTMEQQVRTSLLPQRVASWIFSAFGALAALLACLGLYGVIAYAAAQRTHEIGIRIALGASRGEILRLVGRQGFGLITAGLLLGLLGALGASRALRAFLLGPATSDLPAFAAAAVLVACIALAAIYLPVRRATRVDPVVALREE